MKQIMAIQTTFLEKAEYLIAEVSGQWEKYDAIKTIDTICNEANRRDKTRILIDIRHLIPPSSDLDYFYTGTYFAKLLCPPFKTATLWTMEDYSRFAEFVAVNYGAQVASFFEKDEALKWLLERNN